MSLNELVGNYPSFGMVLIKHACEPFASLPTGNLLVAPGSMFLIDWEFATVGPLSFDLGSLLGNLMLAVLALQGMAAIKDQPLERREQAEWLLQV